MFCALFLRCALFLKKIFLASGNCVVILGVMLYGNWFVGFPVSHVGWYKELRRNLPEGVRVFAAEDLHITVAFLGRLSEEARESVCEAIKQLSFTPVEIALGGLMQLPSPRRFSALSFYLERGRREIEEFMAQNAPLIYKAAGVEPDRRKPLAHLTIARPLRKNSAKVQAGIVKAIPLIVAKPVLITIDSLALYGWDEERKARQFKIDTEVKFGRI